MPIYNQTVRFEKRFEITARNAAEANEVLDEKIRDIEWGSDVESQGAYDFEDEPVQCIACQGNCTVGEGADEKDCEICSGEGYVPFPG